MHILIVDYDTSFIDALAPLLEQCGHVAISATNKESGLQLCAGSYPDIILFDLQIKDIESSEFIKKIREQKSDSIIITMFPPELAEVAIETIGHGASDIIAKPFKIDELLLVLKKAHEREKIRIDNEILKEQVAKRYSFSNIVSKSPLMLDIFDVIKKISDYDTTVLIQGESGTGKELIAHALHYNSQRRNKRFIAINCGAIPENLLESELFGHRRGAFTDATKDKKGLLEEASGGTLLLDEIGELPLHLQVKLLRVLQERVVRPVGDTRLIPVNVRIIAASLRDLESDVIDGRFRDDLFYRLNVISIRLPSLRDRKEDISILVNHFIKKNQEKLELPVYGITKEALSAIMNYSWPGNIRELENCIERAMILTDGNKITLESLPPRVLKGESQRTYQNQEESSFDTDLSIKNHTKILEETLIKKALKKTSGNRTHAAKLLEISHRTLLYKIKELSLEGMTLDNNNSNEKECNRSRG